MNSFICCHCHIVALCQMQQLQLHDRFDCRWWQLCLIVLVFYSAWAFPFEFGFVQNPGRALRATDYSVDIFFAIDIIMTFFVAYVDPRSFLMVEDLKKIALRYLATWLILDITSTVPLGGVAYIFTRKYGTGITYNLLHMLRLWRLRRVSALFARIEKDVHFSYFWTRSVKLFLVSLLYSGSMFQSISIFP
jgi:hypothetical protein